MPKKQTKDSLETRIPEARENQWLGDWIAPLVAFVAGQHHAVCSGLDPAQPGKISERQLDDACCGPPLRVDGKAVQSWREIAAEAAKETNPKKLVEMIEKLCEILETMRLEARARAECIYGSDLGEFFFRVGS